MQLHISISLFDSFRLIPATIMIAFTTLFKGKTETKTTFCGIFLSAQNWSHRLTKYQLLQKTVKLTQTWAGTIANRLNADPAVTVQKPLQRRQDSYITGSKLLAYWYWLEDVTFPVTDKQQQQQGQGSKS